mgnify:CR=1 FL=1
MLIKLILNDADFEKSLKRRRLAGFALLLVGLVGLGCYFLLVEGGDLPDFAQGFYLGAASGIGLGSVILLVRSQYLLTHPEAMKKAKIQETDERQRSIIDASFKWAGCITFFTAAAALFVLLPLSMDAFLALLGMMALYAVSFLVMSSVLEKRM